MGSTTIRDFVDHTAVLRLLGVACGSDDCSSIGVAVNTAVWDDTGDEASATTDVAATAPLDPAPPHFAPSDGGTFRYANNLALSMWDRAQVPQRFGPGYLNAVYGGFVFEQSDGTIAPQLATDREIDAQPSCLMLDLTPIAYEDVWFRDLKSEAFLSPRSLACELGASAL